MSSGVLLLAHFGWMAVDLAVLRLIGVAQFAALASGGRPATVVAAAARPT